MPVTEGELRQDEMELDNLQKMISQMETAKAVSIPGTRDVFAAVLFGAKSRLVSLEKKIKDGHAELASQAQADVVIASLAQKESALSRSEKETYSGFLSKEFFTKKDFGNLEHFYSHTWDRLSEGGKDQMSRRIWEGVRRDEYKFSDLPTTVREKETERAYARLKKPALGISTESRIPGTDRDDFIRAYEGGKRDDAEKVLDREGFRRNLFTQSGMNRRSSPDIGSAKDAERVQKNLSSTPAAHQTVATDVEFSAKADLDLSTLKLDGIKLAEVAKQQSSTEIPRAATGAVQSSPAVGGPR